MNPSWEYKVVPWKSERGGLLSLGMPKEEEANEILNRHGREGWEMVQLAIIPGRQPQLFLKRQR